MILPTAQPTVLYKTMPPPAARKLLLRRQQMVIRAGGERCITYLVDSVVQSRNILVRRHAANPSSDPRMSLQANISRAKAYQQSPYPALTT